LAWNTHEFETNCSDSYIPTYAPPVCEICYCSDYDSTSCPYYIFDEGFARLNSMIETMNKQQAEFENKMRECNLSHETDLRFSSPKLDVCLCDDDASSTPLEFGLEAVVDPSLTTPSLVAPPSPSTLRGNTTFNMTLPAPPLPLAQSTEFEVGETFTVNAGVDEDDVCYDSDNILIEVHDFDATVRGMSYVDVVITVPASFDMVDDMSPDPLDIFHASPLCSLPSPSLECHHLLLVEYHVMLEGNEINCMASLGTVRGYDPSLDPYSLYLGGMPMKIMLTTAFHFFTDFSKAFDKFRRALTIISAFQFKCSYLHPSELHAQVFDRLLRALTTSKWVPRVMRRGVVGDAPSTSYRTILRR